MYDLHTYERVRSYPPFKGKEEYQQNNCESLCYHQSQSILEKLKKLNCTPKLSF
jgi:hypothetical protein